MSTLKEKIKALLVAETDVTSELGLSPMRFFSMHAPQNTVTPYGILDIISREAMNTLKGPTDLEHATVRIHLFGQNATQLDVLRKIIIDLMTSSTTFSALQGSLNEIYEDDTALFHLMATFSVWNVL